MTDKSERIHKSERARLRRRSIKDTIFKRTLNLFSKLRRKKKKRKK